MRNWIRTDWLTSAVLATLLMFGLIGWQALNTFRVSRELQDAFVRGERFRDRIVTLQEEQMLSLAMVVATGRTGWQTQYTRLERELHTAIQLAIREAAPGYSIETLKSLEQAHERLRERAVRAVELARIDRVREGLGMLTSPKFQSARKEFNQQVGKFIADYQQFLKTRLIDERDKAVASLGVGFLIFLISVGVWTVLLRNLALQRSKLAQEVTVRKKAEERLRKLAGHLQAVSEQERSTIARELHDQLAQSLVAVQIDLVRLRRRLSSADVDAMALLDKNVHLVTETMESVQRIFSGLRPSILDHAGLVAAIEWQASEFQERTGIESVLSLENDEPPFEPEVKTALFRIVQESLANASRHSGATFVGIEFQEQDHWYQLTISDNGRGITQEALNDPGSYGLAGMRERVLIFGGTLEIRGVPGKGTTLSVRVPLPPEGNANFIPEAV